MPRAFIGVGSNIEPEANVREALRRLRRRVSVTRVSTFYRTEPTGRPEQPPFHNGIVEVETHLPPLELKQVLRAIEAQLHRERTADRYASRTIDLDLLLYGELVVASEALTLPDPDIEVRAFLAVPLGELAPDSVLPGSGRTLREIAAGFAGHDLQPLAEYTQELRGEVTDGLREG